ncbi:hypothetical protein DDE83_001268 [Stemphylium lycopersici]|uniref:F-box domain-containing protein n=1 Tax=Stemphylium lycopersici TaxID=183478 RepID=A0A364NDR5_STELY|nr:hypothetical protein DDE83_001268 [Stemphylium lycopersici]
MSLFKLPTELDERILEDCDQLSLSRLSRTSTYYRRITEPFLYRDIKLDILNPTAVESLCLNLTKRKPLAQHVRSLSLFQKGAFPSAPKGRVRAHSFPVLSTKQLQEAVLPSSSPPEAIYTSSLALILSRATGLTTLHISPAPYPQPRISLRPTFKALRQIAHVTRLRHLHIDSTRSALIPLLPSLETLAVSHSQHVSLKGAYTLPGAMVNLRSVSFHHTTLRLPWLTDALEDGHLAHVTRFSIRGPLFTCVANYEVYSGEYDAFMYAVSAYAPRLECLELEGVVPQVFYAVLRPAAPVNLSRLKALEVLRVDALALLLPLPRRVLSSRNGMVEALPLGLRSLRLMNTPLCVLQQEEFAAGPVREAILRFRAKARLLRLSDLALEVVIQ